VKLPPDVAARCLDLAAPTRTTSPPTPGRDSVLMTVWLPGLVPVSRANQRGHWAVTMRREREYSAILWASLRRIQGLQWRLPLSVTFHRVGAKLLDDDNLAGAYKRLRDCVADWLRIDDGDRTAAAWAYTQQTERMKALHGTRLTISEV